MPPFKPYHVKLLDLTPAKSGSALPWAIGAHGELRALPIRTFDNAETVSVCVCWALGALRARPQYHTPVLTCVGQVWANNVEVAFRSQPDMPVEFGPLSARGTYRIASCQRKADTVILQTVGMCRRGVDALGHAHIDVTGAVCCACQIRRCPLQVRAPLLGCSRCSILSHEGTRLRPNFRSSWTMCRHCLDSLLAAAIRRCR